MPACRNSRTSVRGLSFSGAPSVNFSWSKDFSVIAHARNFIKMSQASNSAFPLRRYLFWIRYDGSKFPEMARGGTGFGVMDALYQVVGDSIFGPRTSWSAEEVKRLKFSPSSRTDANVHAIKNAVICQVPLKYANFDESEQIKRDFLNRWKSKLESVSPGALDIFDVHRVSAGFCARRNVAYRRYTYRLAVAKNFEIWDSVKFDPSLACFSEKDYSWRIPPGFSPEKLLKAGKLFEGEHVLGSFFKHPERVKRLEPVSPSAVKNILNIDIYPGEAYMLNNDIYDYYNVTIVAKSFVREQIRRMMSCLVNHAYDRLPLETIKWLLENPISSNFFDRRIPIAPPHGLFLTDIVYDPKMFVNPSPYHYHSWDYS